VTAYTPGSEMGPCIVRMDVFEGPLDLLLHLIRKHEIDIFDIPISIITDRYLEYIEAMQELQLDIAVEYLEMAATLAQIKSQVLLPEEPAAEEGEETQGDPREELIRRLLEYKKYKEAARALAEKFILGKDTFTSGADLPEPESRIVTDITMFDLMDLARTLIEKARARGKEGPQFLADRITMAERITQIADIMKIGEKVTFLSLLDEGYSVFDVVITFLAILEMVRLRMISVLQAQPHGDIVISQPIAYEPIAKKEPEAQAAPAEEAPVQPEQTAVETGTAPADGGSHSPQPADEQPPSPPEAPAQPQPPGITGELSDLLSDFLKEK
jgi:segregation and condensation protein A